MEWRGGDSQPREALTNYMYIPSSSSSSLSVWSLCLAVWGHSSQESRVGRRSWDDSEAPPTKSGRGGEGREGGN